MHRVHRVHFEVLETLNAATTGTTEPVFGADTLDAIKRGDFEIIRVQHCCYLPTADVARFLQLICLLYAQPVYDAERITNLAEHLGLKVKTYTGKNNRVTGVMLQKLHGKKVVASLVFYDKKRRVAQMRQGETLHPDEVDIVAKNVRFDMTLHGRGVEQIVGAARKDLAKRREVAPGLLSNAVTPEFFDNKSTTMASFEDAVTVLSHPRGGGVARRQSFAPWLVRKCLHDFLRLGAVVKCTPAKLHAFTELDDPVVKAWYEIGQAQKAPRKKSDAEGWAAPIIERSKLKKSAIYDGRKRLLDEHDIDIAIPYKFYADLEHHGPKSLIDAERREALNRALSKSADKNEVFRLLQEGIDNFFDQLVNVVGKTVSSPPTKLPLKEAGKLWTGSVDVQKKAPDRKSLRPQRVALNRKPQLGIRRSPGPGRMRKWSID